MFLDRLEKELNYTETANGAKANKSTLDSGLDLFGQIGACRENLQKAQDLFMRAYGDNPLLALKILFWARDIRGGQGERKVFRHLLRTLAEKNFKVVNQLVPFVPEFGRWDDLLCLDETECWNTVLDLYSKQLSQDLRSQGEVSLLAKWLPSVNTSSQKSRKLGRKIAKYLEYSEKTYRKTLSQLRSKIKIVEQKMCANEWNEINYSQVPSRASLMYRNSFRSHDSERYSQFLSDVAEGKAKINASTLYPYDIVRQVWESDDSLDVLWDNLPNYLENTEGFNSLVVADVSGSMLCDNGLPLYVSISLGIYISERNTSEVWKNKFLTFSQDPSLVMVRGGNICEKVGNLSRADWGMNTNLMRTFEVILKVAVENSVPAEEMPQKLIIVSDMEFDVAVPDNDLTNFEKISQMFSEKGYKVPQLVFWNVNAGNTVPITKHDTGTCLISGCSPSLLKSVLGDLDPIKVMLSEVEAERYQVLNNLEF